MTLDDLEPLLDDLRERVALLPEEDRQAEAERLGGLLAASIVQHLATRDSVLTGLFTYKLAGDIVDNGKIIGPTKVMLDFPGYRTYPPAGTQSAAVPETRILWCSCKCHDGNGQMCGFDDCRCGQSGTPRVTYPDRPPSDRSGPFTWYWSDQDRPRPYTLRGEEPDDRPACEWTGLHSDCCPCPDCHTPED